MVRYMFCLLSFISNTAVLASEGGSEKVGVFSGTIADSVWTIIWFLALLIALKKFAWKHILAGLQAREDKIAKEIEDAQKIREEAQSQLAEYRKKLAQIDRENAEISKRYMDQTQRQAKAVIDKAQQQAKAVMEKTKTDVELAKAQAKSELISELGEVILGLSNEVLGRTVSREDNLRLIDDAIGKLKEQFNE